MKFLPYLIICVMYIEKPRHMMKEQEILKEQARQKLIDIGEHPLKDQTLLMTLFIKARNTGLQYTSMSP